MAAGPTWANHLTSLGLALLTCERWTVTASANERLGGRTRGPARFNRSRTRAWTRVREPPAHKRGAAPVLTSDRLPKTKRI